VRSFVRLWQRNHRKVLLIDDEIAFIGGVNVGFLATEWADLHVKFVGRKLVAPLLHDFAATYRTLRNHPLVGRFGFVKKERIAVPWAHDQISFVSLAPHWGSDRKFLRNFYLKTLASAQFKDAIQVYRVIDDKDCGNGLVFDGDTAVEKGFVDGLVESMSDILDEMVE
jgi:phosphatidylserine/phosphatidylglycerophosphate/cardiolipin synthase-like enzyme